MCGAPLKGDTMEAEKPQHSDFLEIAALDRVVWAKNRYSAYIPDGEHLWRMFVEFSSVYIVRDRGKIVASSVMFLANSKNLMVLHKVFVEEGYRGKGLGNLLLGAITRDLDAHKTDCLLTTDPQNTKMLRLCEKYQFIERQFVPSYYRTEEDRYVLYRRTGDRHHLHRGNTE